MRLVFLDTDADHTATDKIPPQASAAQAAAAAEQPATAAAAEQPARLRLRSLDAAARRLMSLKSQAAAPLRL